MQNQMNLSGMKKKCYGWLMTKWVNLYIFLFLINIITLIFFNLSIIFTSLLVISAGIVIYFSYKNKTTSIVHVVMLLLSILLLVLSIIRV
jgi:hypothetical protein